MRRFSLLLWTAIFLQAFAGISFGYVGTAAFYGGPYVPTSCYGLSVEPIPTNNMFAAASDWIWENGAACGREYTVRCLSGQGTPNPCIGDTTVKVTIVDHTPPLSAPSSPDTTLVLTIDAFNVIADSVAASEIDIEFLQT